MPSLDEGDGACWEPNVAATAVYADAVRRIRAPLDRMESFLVGLPDGTSVTPVWLTTVLPGPPIPFDQLALAVIALASLGVVSGPSGGPLARQRLRASALFRLGVRMGMDAMTAATATIPSGRGQAALLAALPGGLSREVTRAIQTEASDLRAGLVSLLGGARSHILLASPYWDD